MININKNKTIDKVIDFLFSNDYKKYILILFLLGFLLRCIIVFQIPFGADEMGYAAHSIGFIDSGKLQIHDQDGVWFFLTDLFMKIFGANVFGLRFLSILFGSLSIILIYLLTKEILNKKIALIASFILAFSSYSLRTTIGAMDIPMYFFAILALYFLILYFKQMKISFFVFCWISLGIAIMIKQIAILFIPAFLLYFLFYNSKHSGKFKLKQIFLATFILVLMVTPVLTYNYLLYKDKGLVDMQFSRFFGIAEEKYESISHTLNPFSLQTLLFSHNGELPGVLVALQIFLTSESIFILLFAILGFFLSLKSNMRFRGLIFISFLFPFIFLAGTSLLSNHFVFATFFFALFAAKGIDSIINFFQQNFRKKILYSILLLIFLMSLLNVYQYNHSFFGKNEIQKLIEYKEQNIEEDSLIIVDSRIYRGRIAFMFWDKHYLESNHFPYLLQEAEAYQDNLVSYNVYFIEAVTDDSGWGNIKDQPEFNKSTEQIVSFFQQQEKSIKTVNNLLEQPHFKIYKTFLNLPPGVSEFVDSTHEFFFYPVKYQPKSEVFDNYDTYNLFDDLLDMFAHIILYLEVLLAILSVFFIFYKLYKTS